jgi:hypothetical protein
MRKRWLVYATLGLLAPESVAAQLPAQAGVRAVRIDGNAPRVDGVLDDAVWLQAAPAAGFVQREPREGETATEQTEVRFAFDEEALYVGARMFSRDPSAIRALVARRDRATTSEQILISLDTYRDRRTAYTFAVNAAGVRTDYYHPSDFETAIDLTYDVVWEAATAIDAQGWTAEVRIPLGQLRFDPARDEWGVNLVRRVPARNEDSYWILVGRNETGWSSRMGALQGLAGLPSPRRIDLLPYVATEARLVTGIDSRNPFVHERDTGLRAGGDARMGIGANLTLNATFNPDFGQVEADPAEVNLTAFETIFPERRPFFLESATLFGGRGHFYSRRIGSQPPGVPGSTYFERLDNTTILGAGKLTGRLPSRLSLGVLSAVTAREEVATFDTIIGSRGRAIVAPLTGYGVASLQQEFGRDASIFAVTLTAVERDLEPDSPLSAFLAERAITGLADTRIRWGGGQYDASAYIGFSHVQGDSLAIALQQLSSRRYWQRPDATHVRYDPSRRSISGTQMGINHSKLSGAHWLWDIDYWQESPGFELNDIGAIGTVDDRGLTAQLRYRENTPGKYLRNYLVGVAPGAEWAFDGTNTFQSHVLYGWATLRNFWFVQAELVHQPAVQSDNLTRGGPLMEVPARSVFTAALSNSTGALTRWRAQVSAARDDADGWSVVSSGGVALRPGTRAELSIDPTWTRATASRQFMLSRGDGGAATFGGRYIFAYVDRSEIVARVRLNYAIKPDLTLETYIEPFASSGRFHDFGELRAARSGALRTYGTDGTTITRTATGYTITDGSTSFRLPDRDFNVRSLRSNLVLRWEWRPGSTAFLVWQQNRASSEEVGGRAGIFDIGDALTAAGNNYLAIKVSYWLPIR